MNVPELPVPLRESGALEQHYLRQWELADEGITFVVACSPEACVSYGTIEGTFIAHMN